MANPVLNLRVDPAQRKRWQQAADDRGSGSLSQWMRDACDVYASGEVVAPTVKAAAGRLPAALAVGKFNR